MCLIVGELLPQKNWLETSYFRAKTDSRLPSYCCQRMLTAHHVEIWCPPSLFPSPELQDGSVGPHSFFFRQDVYRLSQDMTQHGSHPGLLANQTPSDEYCRPSRYKLRLRRLGTDCLYVWYCFVFSMLWILILNLRLNKVCIGLFVFIPT